MGGDNFLEFLDGFQAAQDPLKILKFLISIRKEVDWPRQRQNIKTLREKGALKQIVLILQSSKRSIIDVSLSILGNCCLDAKSSRDLVSQYNLLPGLNQVLKRYPKVDSINGRVFRIIGNLSQHEEQWASVIVDKKPQIVLHTVSILNSIANDESDEENDEKMSEGTVVMAIRCLRELLNSNTFDDLVKKYQVLKVIGLLLIKYGTIWQETKNHENIIINIIKLLQKYSKYKNYTLIIEMKTTGALVFLSKILMISPQQVVKIIANFLKISQLNSDLPIPEIFDSFVDILKVTPIRKEFNHTCEECIKCMCLLLEHPANRKNDRCGESIPILVQVLDDLTLESSSQMECIILIVSTLNKCKYNDALITEQIKNNILKVLSDKLKLLIGSSSSLEPLAIAHKTDKKRRNLQDFKRLPKKMRFNREKAIESSSSSNSDEEITRDNKFEDSLYSYTTRHDWSPASPASSCDSDQGMSCTSGLSPPSSPRCQTFAFSESDSDDYSPVCSDAEVSDGDPVNNLNETDACSDLVEETENSTNSKAFTDSNVTPKIRILMHIVKLLKTYVVKLKAPIAEMGSEEFLMVCVKSCTHFIFTDTDVFIEVLELLLWILESHEYLLPLMLTKFIPAVHDLSQLQHGQGCSKCRQFLFISSKILKQISKLAQSEAGKGDIAHKLLRGDSHSKEKLVLVIPYIVKNKSILAKFMLKCGGLETLMNHLQENVGSQQEKSINVLCVLASKKLCIKNPKSNMSPGKLSITPQDMSEGQNTVAFKFDDGSTLRADRALLSENSDFFARLLNGDFKESSQDEIALHNVLSKSFQCLVHLMKRDCYQKYYPMDVELDLKTHLDVIALCDRFLMPDFCAFLTESVEKFRLSYETIPVIYRWSMESHTDILRVECVAYALVADLIDTQRFQMFKNLFDLGYTEELVDDIKTLLVRGMILHLHEPSGGNYKRKRRLVRKCFGY